MDQESRQKETPMAPRDTSTDSTEQTKNGSQKHRQPMQGLDQESTTLLAPIGKKIKKHLLKKIQENKEKNSQTGKANSSRIEN